MATAFLAVAGAEVDPSLVGTWTTKSRKVITGPVMYSLCEDAGDIFYINLRKQERLLTAGVGVLRPTQ